MAFFGSSAISTFEFRIEKLFVGYREFLGELLMSAFNPSRGFFIATPHDRLLYPNPMVMKLFPDNFHLHYEFLGRMLGKVDYFLRH